MFKLSQETFWSIGERENKNSGRIWYNVVTPGKALDIGKPQGAQETRKWSLTKGRRMKWTRLQEEGKSRYNIILGDWVYIEKLQNLKQKRTNIAT